MNNTQTSSTLQLFGVALQTYPDWPLMLYDRVTGRKQARGGKLATRLASLERDVRAVTDRPILDRVSGVEKCALLLDERPALMKAVSSFPRQCRIVVALDRTRFVRAADYDHCTNRDAPLSETDVAVLMDLQIFWPVVLATLLDPNITEDARQGEASKRGGGGRPPTVTPTLERKIIAMLGSLSFAGFQRGRYQTPIRTVADELGVPPSTVDEVLNRLSPWGDTWRERLWMYG